MEASFVKEAFAVVHDGIVFSETELTKTSVQNIKDQR